MKKWCIMSIFFYYKATMREIRSEMWEKNNTFVIGKLSFLVQSVLSFFNYCFELTNKDVNICRYILLNWLYFQLKIKKIIFVYKIMAVPDWKQSAPWWNNFLKKSRNESTNFWLIRILWPTKAICSLNFLYCCSLHYVLLP